MKITGLFLSILLAFAGQDAKEGEAAANASPIGRSHQEKEITVRGEVLDQHCFVIHHGSGPDHAGCSNACISRNVSIGFLAADGEFYVLLGETLNSVKDKVDKMAGKPAVLKGFLETRGGLKAIRMTSIEFPQ